MRLDSNAIEKQLEIGPSQGARGLMIVFGFVGGLGLLVAGAMTPLWPSSPLSGFVAVAGGLVMLAVGIGGAAASSARGEAGPIVVSPVEEDGLLLGLREDRSPVVWPRNKQSQHCLIAGAPGQGKSVLLLMSLAFQKVLRGGSVIALDAKPEDDNIKKYLWLVKKARGGCDDARFLIPDRPKQSHTLNIVELGGPEEQTALLCGLRRFEGNSSTEYYANVQEDAVAAVVAALQGTKMRYHVGDVVAALSSQKARDLLVNWPNNDGARQLGMVLARYRDPKEGFSDKRWFFELGGLITVLRKLIRTAGDIVLVEKGEINVYEMLKNRGVLYVALPTGTASGLAWSWALMMVKIASAAASKLIRENFKTDEPGLVLADEFSRYCSDDAAEAFAIWRAASLGIAAAIQSPVQLREGGTRELEGKIYDNSLYKIFFSVGAEGSEAAAEQIGKAMLMQRTYSMGNGRGLTSGQGWSRSRNENAGVSAREFYNYRVLPHDIRSLPVGGAYVTWKGDYAKVRTPFFDVPAAELEEFELTPGQKVGGAYATKTTRGIGLWKEFQREVDQMLGKYVPQKD